ncbi:hypothetical protein PVIIG_05592 [Plasmodium vivax India VII]|uniref:Variable surface protein Vir10 n=1 Tax=Plasmodium vivax India VII TaxID=1077284 RepID=A0A0J9UUQ9_PLAVI|nr:hypothetical protein PVIIG_05592 [Plasmodium vivax India VII]
MKQLKNDYPKKKGLKKLDCYCEEKIFNGIEKFDKVTDNMNCSKVIISVIFYIIKKIIKYDAIKAGNSKMKYKEYISYMKEGYRHK